jgi:MraZ protein
VFKGTYEHKIDGKGRLPVPAAFRRALTEAGATSVVVTLLDQCLAVYPPAHWARLEDQLQALPAFSPKARGLTRLLLSRANDCELDVQGRILLPPDLRIAARLERDAVVVGVLNRFEIWEPGVWRGFLSDSEQLLDDASFDVQWPVPAPPRVEIPPPAPPASDTRTRRPR